MDPLGDVLLAVHEDLGDDFFCMICTNMTYMCHILSHLALKNYFLAVLEKSLSWVMVVTLILESLICVKSYYVRRLNQTYCRTRAEIFRKVGQQLCDTSLLAYVKLTYMWHTFF